MIREEQETTVAYGAVEQVVRVFSTVPKHIRKLRSRDGVVIIRDEGDLIQVEIPMAAFDPLSGFKRKSTPMSPEQKEAATRRLREARGLTP